jgi:hypothetical protein
MPIKAIREGELLTCITSNIIFALILISLIIEIGDVTGMDLTNVGYLENDYINITGNCFAYSTIGITSNLIGAWILIDGINTGLTIPSDVPIEKPGEHNVTLVKGDITIIKYVPVNESLINAEINLNENNSITALLRYNSNGN